jgi:hypothetical protein
MQSVAADSDDARAIPKRPMWRLRDEGFVALRIAGSPAPQFVFRAAVD